MRLVLDTSVIVAAFRSRRGASRRLFGLLVEGRFALVATPALFLEYESVLSRPEQVGVHGYSSEEIDLFLQTLAKLADLVRVRFQWKPQLRDPGDEFVLEAAINGHADAIVTFNIADFLPATKTFGIEVMRPGSIIRERLRG
jgi:putative PIN family toxin of toxin-antitoxin system